MSRRRFRILLFALPCLAFGQSALIDDFRYANPVSATQTWRPQQGAPAIAETRPYGMVLPIPFTVDRDRVFWDRSVLLDLSPYESFRLEISCSDPAALRSLAIYFKSGAGWYIWNQPLRGGGRQALHLQKGQMSTEGKPTGWHHIEAIRISPWKGESINTTLTLHQLTAERPTTLLIRNQNAPVAEQTAVRRANQRLSQWLSELDISHAIIDDQALSADRLQAARVIILGYNPVVSASLRKNIQSFVERGGKVMVLYGGDPELAALLHFRLGAYQQAAGPGRWSSMQFPDAARLRLPDRVFQNSWNIRPAFPAHPRAHVLASWLNAQGQPTGDPAWTASERGLWMSHILLPGDDHQKRALLGGLLASLDPTLWRTLARQSAIQAGQVGPYHSFPETISALRTAPRRAELKPLLDRAIEQHRRLGIRLELRQYPEAVDLERALQRTLQEAFALAQPSARDTMRGVWDHSGTGLYPGEWPRTMQWLADHGINAVFINVMWGGVAHYPSEVLPRSNTFRLYGDQIEQAISAAKRYGIQVHAWVVCWNLTGAPAEFVERARQEGRTITASNGGHVNWLNPAHPENVQQLIRALDEMATRYRLDGIHLDYIRYPDRHACYSDYTREAFRKELGEPIRQWPQDALPGGALDDAYRHFRVRQIDHVVESVHRRVSKPHGLPLSVAVWGGYPQVTHSIGQDWGRWMQKGWVDFVVPMNYSEETARFTQLTRDQLHLPRAQQVRIYPGIGVTAAESRLRADQVIMQIQQARQLGAAGWVLFDLNPSLAYQTLPYLRMGTTAP